MEIPTGNPFTEGSKYSVLQYASAGFPVTGTSTPAWITIESPMHWAVIFALQQREVIIVNRITLKNFLIDGIPQLNRLE